MQQVYVVTKDGNPIKVYDQQVITPMEIWDKYGACSVFSVDLVESIKTEEMV